MKAVCALKLGNYWRLSRIYRESPFLIGCLLHPHVTAMNIRAMNVMSKAFMNGERIPLEALVHYVAIDSVTDLVHWCNTIGAVVTDGCWVVQKKQVFDNTAVKLPRSKILDAKLVSLPQLVQGNSECECDIDC